MRDPIPLKEASCRIALKQIKARDEVHNAGARLIKPFGRSEHRWNAQYGDREFVEDLHGYERDKARTENDVIEAIRSAFASGAWLAWGFKLNAAGGASGDTLEPIGREAWNRFDIVRFPENIVGSSRAGNGYEGVMCAPLLSEAAKDRAPELLAGRSLVEVFDCFVLADPEVQSLFERGRADQGVANFADAFSGAAVMGLTLPIKSKEAAAAALWPVVTGLMREHSAELTDALAARIDALAALLDRAGVPMNWKQGEDTLEAQPFGSNFDREIDRLRLPKLAVERGNYDVAPITDVAFPSAERLKGPVVLVERGDGRNPLYMPHLQELVREVCKASAKARGFKTQKDIHVEIFRRVHGSDPTDSDDLELVRKALGRKPVRDEAQNYLGLLIHLGKVLDKSE